jgi:hypothetical protein
MAFTTPGTAVAGEVLTAAFWNTNVRDNTNAIRLSQTNVAQTAKTDTSDISIAQNALSADISGLTLAFTPKFSTSKVLVTCNINFACSQSASIGFVLHRDGNPIGTGATAGNRGLVTASVAVGNDTFGFISFHYLDSPATTSSVTYSVRARHGFAGSVGLYINRRQTDTDSLNLYRGASFITAQEVAA